MRGERWFQDQALHCWVDTDPHGTLQDESFGDGEREMACCEACLREMLDRAT